jgi:hypothetical protein
MPRRVAVDLELIAAKYLNEARKVEVATKVVDEDMKALGRAADAVGRDMDELVIPIIAGKREIKDLGDKSRNTALEMRLLDERIKATRRSVHELGVAWAADTGNKDVAKSLREQRSLLAQLERVAKDAKRVALDAEGAATRVGSSSAGGVVGTPGIGPVVVGGVIAAVIAASPTIGALIGGALAGATGTAAMAAGIAAASRDPRVQAAASDVGKTISAEIGRTGVAFVDPTIKALHILDRALVDIHVPESLAKLAPDVEIIARGFAALLKNVMPGLNTALDRMGPFADAAAAGFADMGDAIGGFFDDVTASKGTVEGLATAFALLNGSVRLLGGTIHFLSDAYREEIKLQRILLAEAEGAALVTGNTALAAQLHAYGVGIDNMVAGTHEAANAQSTLVNHIDVTTLAIDRQRAKIEAVLGLYEKWFGIAMSLDEAQLRVNQGMLDLQETFKTNGRHWEDNTRAGLANREALLGQIRSLNDLREAELAAGHDAEKTNAKYDAQIEVLLGIARQAGATKAMLDQLRGEYEIHLSISGLVGVTSAVNALANLAGSAVSKFWGGHRAAGGPVVPGGTYQVGENGPEWLTMGASGLGWVTPMAQQPVAQQYQSASVGGGGALPPVNITVQLVDPTTGAVRRQSLITDALNRGKSSAVVQAAYP